MLVYIIDKDFALFHKLTLLDKYRDTSNEYKVLEKYSKLPHSLEPKSLVVINFDLASGQNATLSSIQELADLNTKTRFLLYSKDKSEELKDLETTENFTSLPLPMQTSHLLDEFATIEGGIIKGYYPISLGLLSSTKKVPSDVFVRTGLDKHIKIFNKGDDIDIARIEKFQSDGIKSLFVSKDDFYQMLDRDSKQAEKKISKEKSASPGKSEDVGQFIYDVAKNLGINTIVIEKTKEVITRQIDFLKKKNGLTSLLEKFDPKTNPLIYGHSYLAGLLACQVASGLDWQSNQTFEKLMTAAIFHDLAIEDDQHVMLELDLKKGSTGSNKSLKKSLNDHSLKASQLLETAGIDMDIVKLVANHHEGKGELSYPRGLSASHITQLQAVFNVSHDASVLLYKFSFNMDKKEELFANLVARFPSSVYKTSLTLLGQTFQS